MRITPNQKVLFCRILFFAGALLFVASISVHIFTLFSINLQKYVPFVFLLHIGIFVLIAPCILLQKLEDKTEAEEIISLKVETEKLVEIKPHEKESNLQNWILALYFILGFYVLINFMIFIIGVKGQPEISNGKYILKDKSKIVKELTKEEYDIESAKMLRGFSGHWLLFYFYISSVGYLNGFRGKEFDSENFPD